MAENICRSFLTDGKERSWGLFEAEVMELNDGGGVEARCRLVPGSRCVTRSHYVSLSIDPANVRESYVE